MDWDETNPAISAAEPSAIRLLMTMKSLVLIGFFRLCGSAPGIFSLRTLSDRILLMADTTALRRPDVRAPMTEKFLRNV